MIDGLLSGAWTLGAGYLLPFLFVLTVVVFVHEMGHYLVGRWCGTGVQSFSIGFGPEIFGYTAKDGTRWRIGAIPLGGYVKFTGDMNGASVPDNEDLARMSPGEIQRSFHHKTVAQRAAIVAAGPIANFILAIAIFTGTIYVNGRQVQAPRVESVQPQSAAERAGILPGDVILSVDGVRTSSFSDVQRQVIGRAGEAITIRVQRAGEERDIVATPDLRELSTNLGKQRIGQLGIRSSANPADLRHESYSLGQAFVAGMQETWFVVERTGDYIGKLVVGRESPDQLSGPIRIAQASGHVASVGIAALLSLTALLSVSIGLINLVPIPLLDGGHLLFYAIEAVRGRPLGQRAQEVGFRIGLAFVVTLMIVATFNDVVHLGTLFSARG